MTTRSVTLAALLVALGRPSWWLLALAGFLVRGGVLFFGLAVISLPSPLILSNIVAPLIVPVALGRFDQGTVGLIVLGVGLVLAWLIGGGALAASTEVLLIREARNSMIDEGLAVARAMPVGRRLVSRVTAVRLLAHLPTALVLGIGSVQIGNVAYLELTSPFEVATPLVIRIIEGAAAPIAVIVGFWLLGEIVGGYAARRIVLGGASIGGGLKGAIADLLTRPQATLLPSIGTMLVLAIDLAALLAAVGFVWDQLRDRVLDSPADGGTLRVALLAFGATWIGALVLTGLLDAWRSAAMTFELERAAGADAVRSGPDPDHGGTFGASPGRRPGDWSTGDRGGSL